MAVLDALVERRKLNPLFLNNSIAQTMQEKDSRNKLIKSLQDRVTTSEDIGTDNPFLNVGLRVLSGIMANKLQGARDRDIETAYAENPEAFAAADPLAKLREEYRLKTQLEIETMKAKADFLKQNPNADPTNISFETKVLDRGEGDRVYKVIYDRSNPEKTIYEDMGKPQKMAAQISAEKWYSPQIRSVIDQYGNEVYGAFQGSGTGAIRSNMVPQPGGLVGQMAAPSAPSAPMTSAIAPSAPVGGVAPGNVIPPISMDQLQAPTSALAPLPMPSPPASQTPSAVAQIPTGGLQVPGSLLNPSGREATVFESRIKEFDDVRKDINLNADAARSTLGSIRAISALRNEVDGSEGVLNKYIVPIQQIAADVTGIDSSKLSAKEAWNAILNDMTIGKAAALKPLSNSDVAFVQATIPNVANTKMGNDLIIAAMEKSAVRAILTSDLAQEYQSMMIKQGVNIPSWQEFLSTHPKMVQFEKENNLQERFANITGNQSMTSPVNVNTGATKPNTSAADLFR